MPLYYRISFIRDSGKSKSTGTEITPGDDSAGGMGRAEGWLQMDTRGFFRGDGNLLYHDCGGDSTIPNI